MHPLRSRSPSELESGTKWNSFPTGRGTCHTKCDSIKRSMPLYKRHKWDEESKQVTLRTILNRPRMVWDYVKTLIRIGCQNPSQSALLMGQKDVKNIDLDDLFPANNGTQPVRDLEFSVCLTSSIFVMCKWPNRLQTGRADCIYKSKQFDTLDLVSVAGFLSAFKMTSDCSLSTQEKKSGMCYTYETNDNGPTDSTTNINQQSSKKKIKERVLRTYRQVVNHVRKMSATHVLIAEVDNEMLRYTQPMELRPLNVWTHFGWVSNLIHKLWWLCRKRNVHSRTTDFDPTQHVPILEQYRTGASPKTCVESGIPMHSISFHDGAERRCHTLINEHEIGNCHKIR